MTPDQYTIQEFFIDVGDGHQLYVHDWGNQNAKLPILSLHGGPGSAHDNRFKGRADPRRQRVIFFDQRGAGRSLPHGSLQHNTTDHLVADIEKILQHLRIKQVVLVGGSWGSTLALAYGLKHPKRVAAMVLDGIFTGSQSEIDWLDQGLFRIIFPDAWDRYLATVPKSHQDNPSGYHFRRILSDDADAARLSGHAYETLEASVMQLDDRFAPSDPAEYDPANIRLEVHYLTNRCFLPDRHILNNAHKLTMPIWLLQGRYDMVCPPITAWELAKLLPNGHLIWNISGHRGEHETVTLRRAILLQLTEKK